MSITTITFKDPVAKVVDTPWNTIINGLNYTKTNLAPIPLKYAEGYHSTGAMVLPQAAFNAIETYASYPTIRSYVWNGGMRDAANPNNYFLQNSLCEKYNNSFTEGSRTSYFISKRADDSGRTYSEMNSMTVGNTSNAMEFIHQDEKNVHMLSFSRTGTSAGSATIYKAAKKDGYLQLVKQITITNYASDGLFLGENNGKLFFAITSATDATYGTSNFCIFTYNLSSEVVKTEYQKQLNPAALCNIASSTIEDGELFFVDVNALSKNSLRYPEFYKLTFNQDYSSITETKLTLTDDSNENSYSSSLDNLSNSSWLRVFLHSYTIDNEKYLVKVNVNCNTVSDSTSAYAGDSIKFYRVQQDQLTEVNSLGVPIYNIIPKNNWNSIFAACNDGVRVFALDKINKQIIQQPSIQTNLYQFGFDLDERLWVLSRDGAVDRYNYNQPATIRYEFEKQKYPLVDSSPISSYVGVSVMNYFGEQLNMTVTLQAIGNFTFQGGQKEIEIALNSQTKTQIPIIITGAGIYQVNLKQGK